MTSDEFRNADGMVSSDGQPSASAQWAVLAKACLEDSAQGECDARGGSRCPYRDLLVEISRRDGAIHLEHSVQQSGNAQRFAQRCGGLGRVDACHAAEVDGTFALEARAAIDFVTKNPVEIAER